MNEKTTPKPHFVDPDRLLEKLPEAERTQQINDLEEIHRELLARLNKAQG